MKKLLMTVLMLVGVATFAGVVEPFKQFEQNDYIDYYRNDQHWISAEVFTLKVKAGSSVWLSNFCDDFNSPIPDLHNNVFDMSAGRYGYIFKNDLDSLSLKKSEYSPDKINWSNGAKTTITYISGNDQNNANDPTLSESATAYFLDNFKEEAEIYLVMTTRLADVGVGNDAKEQEAVDTYQHVSTGDTLLLSRQHNNKDNAGNVRVTFGIDSTSLTGLSAEGEITVQTGREFVAVYSGPFTDGQIHEYIAGGSTGGPLPGVFFAGLLSLGTVFGASKAKRQKRA